MYRKIKTFWLANGAVQLRRYCSFQGAVLSVTGLLAYELISRYVWIGDVRT
jgi:hypothetical protein